MSGSQRPPAGPAGPRLLWRLAPLAISAACLWALATRLDWPGVGAALATAHWPLGILAAGLTLANIVVRAVRWRLLLGNAAPRLATLVSTYTVGSAAGLLVPASGELTRALLLARRSGARTSYVLGIVAVEKLLDTGTVVALFAASLWYAAGAGWLRGAAWTATVVLLGLAAALVVAWAWAPHNGLPAPAWLPRGLARAWQRLGVAVAEAWVRFAGGVATVARLPRPIQAGILALTLLSWAVACFATVCALAAFGLPTDWAVAAVLYGALLVGLSVPSAPAALGTFELVVVAVLEAFGLPLEHSAAFAVGFHALTFAPLVIAAALVSGLSPAGDRRMTDAAGGIAERDGRAYGGSVAGDERPSFFLRLSSVIHRRLHL